VYCGKTVDWIRMPFGVVSGVSRGMGILDGGGYRQWERGSFGVKLGRPFVTNGAFATRLFSNYFEDLFHLGASASNSTCPSLGISAVHGRRKNPHNWQRRCTGVTKTHRCSLTQFIRHQRRRCWAMLSCAPPAGHNKRKN